MKQIDLVKLHKKLARKLDDDRYLHTLGVEYTAASLAMKYGCSVLKARLAGLLHDCAKGIESSEYPDLLFVYPVHLNPLVQEPVKEILGTVENVLLTSPIDVEDMHNIMSRSFLVMTDSGGLIRMRGATT